MTFSQILLRDLILETRDGDWGQDVPKEGFGPYRVIRGGDFSTVELGDVEKVPRCYLKASTVQRRTLKAGDLLIETAGGTKDCPTGRVLYISQEVLDKFDLPVTCASFARFIRLDEKQINPNFVFWHLRDMHQRGEMWQHQVQHTGVARFQWTKFADSHLVDTPPRDEQDRLVGVMDSLSAKGLVNRQINQTLEQIAQTIFKSWFVDFEPVKAKIEAKAAGRDPERAAMCAISGKLEPELDQLPPEQYQQLAATATLFPDELVESELGLIPEGWECKTLGTVAKNKAASFDFGKQEKVIFINTGDVSDGVFLHADESEKIGLPGQAKKAIGYDDILYSEIRPKNRRYAYINFDAEKYVVSTKFMVIRSLGKIEPRILYQILTQSNAVDEINSIAESRSGTFPQITFDSISYLPIVVASREIQKHYLKTLIPIVDLQERTNEQTNLLATLRDTLLPKLLSGELAVEKLPEEATV
jgi:type I restriction enzyme S subunit